MSAKGSVQEARLLALFDFCWFEGNVLQRNPGALSGDGDGISSEVSTVAEGASLIPIPGESTCRYLLGGCPALASSSDSAILDDQSTGDSDDVLSGTPTSEEGGEAQSGIYVGRVGATEEKRRVCKKWRATRRVRRSRSLSELQLEELKGFMDLGFTFTEEKADDRLLSIIPGLQWLGWRPASSGSSKNTEGDVETGVKQKQKDGRAGVPAGIEIRRPLHSETREVAWDLFMLEERAKRYARAHDQLLRKWRVPARGDDEDMKAHLRWWAHAVAASVQ